MEENKKRGIPLGVFFLVIIVLVVIAVIVVVKTLNTSEDGSEEESVAQSETTNEDSGEIQSVAEDIIVLYTGEEISSVPGIYTLAGGMEINDENIAKYNITYYNYEKGGYAGSATGTFGEETSTLDGIAAVLNVSTIAISSEYDAIPRTYTTISEIPDELADLADASSVDIQSVDLDGDGYNEYIVCYTYDRSADETDSGEAEVSSTIMLLDSNYQKIADLVNLADGYWAGIKDEEYKILLSLDDVIYVDIDNDNIMEILINVPQYDGTSISILKYQDGVISGEAGYEASVLP